MRLLRFAAWLVAVVILGGCSRQAPGLTPHHSPAVLPSSPAGDYPFTVTDDLGVRVTFAAPPRRIVSLAPNVTEILFAIGVGDRIVGVTSFCDYPPQAKEKEQVGGYIDFSVEKVVSLSPDVVFTAHGTPAERIEALQGLGLKVFGINPLSYDEVVDRIKVIGRICGVPDKAAAVARRMEQVKSAIRRRTSSLAGDERPAALCIIELDPLWVAGPGTFVDDMLRVCGARNVAAATNKKWSQMAMEAVIAADPAVLIITARHDGAQPTDYLHVLRANETWRAVKAVQQGRIVVIDEDLVTIPGPRLAEGLKQMAAGIHPELFGKSE